MTKILIADPIAPEGIEYLESQAEVEVRRGLNAEELMDILGDYDALIVRSETKVTRSVIAAGKKLQVIARAGVGVDNIDLEAATSGGIAVVNAPAGNTIAAAEHTLALILATARNVPQAHGSMKQGRWERGAFMGIEVRNKTLGIIGLGRVGSEVARRARSFSMRTIAFDPFVSPEYAQLSGVELQDMNELLSQCDFLTLHTAYTYDTHHLIGAKELALMKPTAYVVNVARGELLDEDAILAALEEGRLAGAALDVFSTEPPQHTSLVNHPKVIVTPHLGASTREAQREVALEASEQVLAVLRGEPARNMVNGPFVPPEVHAVIDPYAPVANTLGKLLIHLTEGRLITLQITYEGEIARHDTTILKSSALAGFLTPISEERINVINAPTIADQRGLNVTERKRTETTEYGSLITLGVTTTSGSVALTGACIRNEAHLVRVNDHWLDVVPYSPYLLFIEHQDQPGSIGAVGNITGQNDINISFMEVGRISPRGRATMIVGLDDPIPTNVLDQIRALPHIDNVRLIRM
jgi:D-3-phosphoglycerate dehydrogenase